MECVRCPECPVCPDGQTRNECITCLQCPEQNQNLIPCDEGSGSDLCCVSKRKTSSVWTGKIRDAKDAFGAKKDDLERAVSGWCVKHKSITSDTKNECTGGTWTNGLDDDVSQLRESIADLKKSNSALVSDIGSLREMSLPTMRKNKKDAQASYDGVRANHAKLADCRNKLHGYGGLSARDKALVDCSGDLSDGSIWPRGSLCSRKHDQPLMQEPGVWCSNGMVQ